MTLRKDGLFIDYTPSKRALDLGGTQDIRSVENAESLNGMIATMNHLAKHGPKDCRRSARRARDLLAEYRKNQKPDAAFFAGIYYARTFANAKASDAKRGARFSPAVGHAARRKAPPKPRKDPLKEGVLSAFTDWREEAGESAPMTDFFRWVEVEGEPYGLFADGARIWQAGDTSECPGVTHRAARNWLS